MSHNQPGPYGGQPQQPGQYGQPGPYGQQPPQAAPQPGYGYPQQAPPQQPGYGYPQQAPQGVPPQTPPYGQQQAPYGQQPYPTVPQPPVPSGGGGKKVGIILGAVAVVAAVAVGAYFVLGGGGGSDIADDGPHKLTTPAKVLNGEFKKSESAGSGGFNEDDIKEAEDHGVKNAKDVGAGYQAGDESNPLSAQMINFMGVYGEIDDPESVVDAMFADMKKEASKDASETGELVGSPETFTPSALDGAVLKCQETKFEGDSSAGGPSKMSVPICIWGDHSTIGVVIYADMASAMGGKAADLSGAADKAANFRKDVRVKA
ncbi:MULTISPECIES: hypothetical protein [unclassified Streptomyces]|uniref:hypothetical protein n=1 Tax=unclassified Streptomyces TaxID=2593676 RepID=UPI0008E44579|nr:MULTISPECIES: hypothetical protein [unclassified Streptomyces]UJV43506.1 hypothetical protein CVT30_29970 [Streptomyces sp. AMCC400023]SFN47534.1 hypothetical protein SAMN04487980_1021100 [Streptomyces sp. cf124]